MGPEWVRIAGSWHLILARPGRICSAANFIIQSVLKHTLCRPDRDLVMRQFEIRMLRLMREGHNNKQTFRGR